jgi:hypothetical protein
MSTNNRLQARTWIAVIARLAAAGVLAWIVVAGVQAFSPGIKITGYRETTTAEAGTLVMDQVYYRQYPPALGYAGFAGLAALGLVRQRWLLLAWLGTLALAAWSTIWLFSSGAAFVPAVVALVALLVVLTLAWPRPTLETELLGKG